MLKLKDIKKDYITGDSKVEALKGVSVSFRKSEFVSILGQSGCGKTTLLNIIGGLDKYTSGDLIIRGKSTKDFKDCDWDSYRNHSIGFVFQSYNLIPHQTVLSNVELALTISGVSKSERRKRAINALEQVGLGDQLHKKPNQMSGGQMQRVAIARALVNDPDILLADEPTGALDTETSVQIMELLKSISKDKLIIMVTHNPELAQKYSSRIIKLLDGKIIDDSSPYDDEDEPVKDEPKTKEEIKRAKKERKKLKTSMNFLTALSLSRNNLLTKKARTLLTSFAGSIGIIGIALILSLSNGVQVYIDSVQSDTLSTYPLTINETTASMSSAMASMADDKKEKADHGTDKVYSQNNMGDMVNTLLDETKVNNLEKFKKYLDGKSELKDLTTDIQYEYSTTLNIFKADTSQGAFQVNPSTVMTDIGYTEDQMGAMSSIGMGQSDVWTEMINNEDLIRKQYDVVAGKLPEKYNEVMLVVNSRNEVPDYVLYSLGIMDSKDIKGLMTKIMKGEKVTVDTSQKSYTYDEILNLKFRLVPSTDFYKKTETGWEDMKDDESYMKEVVDKGEEIKIVGIVRPSEESTAASIKFGIGYRKELMSRLISKVKNSDIVKEQLENKDTDVFTGFRFAKDGENKSSDESAEKAEALMKTQGLDQSQTGGMSVSDMASGKTDMSKLTDTQKKYLASLSDEQMKMLQEIMKEQSEQIKKIQNDEISSSTYDENMKKLGYALEEKPSSINIYPVDFASKEKITDMIDVYNNNASEDDKIEYTDYMGLMMSSVTSIINAISYVLIAFVAISLVVSSIMIGIITYISVLERTKEIGILRAIGASKKDISRVFNAETVIVGFVAGAMGIAISYLLTIPINSIIRSLTKVPVRASIPVGGAVILVVISIFLTLIAGLFPSRIAAKKDPVIALRTE